MSPAPSSQTPSRPTPRRTRRTPAEHLRALAEETRATLRLAADAHRRGRGPAAGVPRFPRAAPPSCSRSGRTRATARCRWPRRCPPDGRIVTLRARSRARARSPSATSPTPATADRIEVRAGPALETIATLDGPFDLVFIDADKAGYLGYYEAVLPKLSERGADRRRQRAVERPGRRSRRPTTTTESTRGAARVQRPRRRRRARRQRDAHACATA